jgi:hypothetical protein|tara:strand:- start:3757 stop:3936 length:180 start_codon:yes stop_codon:yes gene_type:complete
VLAGFLQSEATRLTLAQANSLDFGFHLPSFFSELFQTRTHALIVAQGGPTWLPREEAPR